MQIQTAARLKSIRRSFVREILKVTARPDVISFAGGLPSPQLIPVAAISEAAQEVLWDDGAEALQYCTTEGYPPLRAWIADRYRAVGMDICEDQILITTGSQQAIDLLGKVLLDPGDRLIVEDPTYIAAIQAFGFYEPAFVSVPVDEQGVDPAQLESALKHGNAKAFYCMPNFQNPSGISYSADRRQEVVRILQGHSAILIEDDPYGMLRFRGEPLPPIGAQMPERSVLLGSFSKIIAPGLRLGWICAPRALMDKLIIAKQAVDLHSENLGQRVVHRIVTGGQFDTILLKIRSTYGRQCDAMLDAITKRLPEKIRTTRPDGGMFLWGTLPEGMNSTDLFHRAIEKGVAFVPGEAFHANGGGERTMRLNFSNSDPARIEEGVRRLAAAFG